LFISTVVKYFQCYILQAGTISGISSMMLIGSSIDVANVSAAREAATEIFDIINKVCIRFE